MPVQSSLNLPGARIANIWLSSMLHFALRSRSRGSKQPLLIEFRAVLRGTLTPANKSRNNRGCPAARLTGKLRSKYKRPKLVLGPPSTPPPQAHPQAQPLAPPSAPGPRVPRVVAPSPPQLRCPARAYLEAHGTL